MEDKGGLRRSTSWRMRTNTFTCPDINAQRTLSTQNNATHSSSPPSCSPIDLICDESMCLIMSFLDFPSSLIFGACSSKKLNQRIFGPSSHKTDDQIGMTSLIPFHRLWKSMYQRSNFAPPDEKGFGSIMAESSTISYHLHSSHEYIKSYRYKQRLLHALINVRPRSKHHHHQSSGELRNLDSYYSTEKSPHDTRSISCFSLPTRYFYFLPITPHRRALQNHLTPHALITNQNEGEEEVNHEEEEAPMYINDDSYEDDDLPVDFMCASYALLSPSTSGEYVLLDPFHGTIAVYDNVMTGALGNDDFFHQELHKNLTQLNISHIDDDDMVTNNHQACDMRKFDDLECSNYEDLGHQNQQSKDAAEVLFSVEDYFNIDLHDYFSADDNQLARMNEAVYDPDDDEVVVDWIGIDVHTMINPLTLDKVGTMICAARSILMDATRVEDEQCCTEILAWKRLDDSPSSKVHRRSTRHDFDNKADRFRDSKYICRLDGSPYYMEVNAVHETLYVSFPPSERDASPHQMDTNEAVNDDNGEENGDDVILDETGVDVLHSNRIAVFPLLPSTSAHECERGSGPGVHNDSRNAVYCQRDSFGRSYFPSPIDEIVCHDAVTCFVIDSTGEKLIVGTANGCIEVRDVGITKQYCKESYVKIVNIGAELKQLRRTPSIKVQEIAATAHVERVSSSPELVSLSDDSISLDEEVGENSFTQTHEPVEDTDECMVNAIEGISDGDGSFSLPQCNPSRKICCIIIPKHLPVEQAGFVVSQYHKSEGTTLTLWQYCSDGRGKELKMMSLINLPLSPQRKPEVYYDGKRLIVFGQDHIGLIVLVYHVLSTQEDQEASKFKKQNGKDSGGVINLIGKDSRILYVNRIRHAGLGGFDFLDNMFMTANERFIVVNTKTGGLINEGTRGTHEGLFIIDLQQGL